MISAKNPKAKLGTKKECMKFRHALVIRFLSFLTLFLSFLIANLTLSYIYAVLLRLRASSNCDMISSLKMITLSDTPILSHLVIWYFIQLLRYIAL